MTSSLQWRHNSNMKAYNVEFFDEELNYITNTCSEDINYKEDYLDPERSKITVFTDTDIKTDYFLRVKAAGVEFVGRISSIEQQDDGTAEIAFRSLAEMLDTDVLVTTSDLTGNLETFINNVISDLYVDNSDDEMNIPLVITEKTSTSTWALDLFDTDETSKIVNLFDDIIIPAFGTYGIILTFGLDISNSQITLSIGKNTAITKYIEADLPNVLDKSIIIQKAKKRINKITVYNDEDFSENVTYYLHSDGSFDTTDSDRITPVVYDLLTVSTSSSGSFSDKALAKAQKTFNKNKYDNLIELSLMNDDELLSPWAVGMGQIVNVISDGVSYGSILTGREMKDNVTTLIFGTIRQELTKYLKGRAN